MSNNRTIVGEKPPDFTLEDTYGNAVTLSDFQGKEYVYLIFNRGFT